MREKCNIYIKESTNSLDFSLVRARIPGLIEPEGGRKGKLPISSFFLQNQHEANNQDPIAKDGDKVNSFKVYIAVPE